MDKYFGLKNEIKKTAVLTGIIVTAVHDFEDFRT